MACKLFFNLFQIVLAVTAIIVSVLFGITQLVIEIIVAKENGATRLGVSLVIFLACAVIMDLLKASDLRYFIAIAIDAVALFDLFSFRTDLPLF